MNTTLITSALVWERGLEFEEDRRRTQQREPSANNLAPVQRLSKRERVPVLARLFKPRPQPAPAVYTPSRDCCPET